MKNCNIFNPHIWSKWEKFKVYDMTAGGKKYGEKYFYKKTCERCGKEKFYSRVID